jgi:hypothetical protein
VREERSTDVDLDVPELKLGKLDLDLGKLNGRISIKAQLGRLLDLSAGIDLDIEDIRLSIDDMETTAIVKFRLDKVAEIFRRTLDALDKNPELFRSILEESTAEPGGTTQIEGNPDDAH